MAWAYGVQQAKHRRKERPCLAPALCEHTEPTRDDPIGTSPLHARHGQCQFTRGSGDDRAGSHYLYLMCPSFCLRDQ